MSWPTAFAAEVDAPVSWTGQAVQLGPATSALVSACFAITLRAELAGLDCTQLHVAQAIDGVLAAASVTDASGVILATVIGPRYRAITDLDLNLVGCVLRGDGQVLATGAGGAASAGPLAAVAALASSTRGGLAAGSLVTVGPLTRPVPIAGARWIEVRFAALGTVGFTVAAPAGAEAASGASEGAP